MDTPTFLTHLNNSNIENADTDSEYTMAEVWYVREQFSNHLHCSDLANVNIINW